MQICVCMNFLLWNMIGKRSQRTRSAAATLIRWWVNAGSTMRVPTDTILKACPITLILDKLNNQYTSSLWYFNVHPKLQLQTHPIVKSKSWTLPRQHLCSADDDAVRPCCWSFSTISFFSGTLSDIYMYMWYHYIYNLQFLLWPSVFVCYYWLFFLICYLYVAWDLLHNKVLFCSVL